MSREHPVAVVTGAARGIGAATAARLAARGVTVALIDIPLEAPGRLGDVPGPYRPAHGADLDEATALCAGRGHAHAADVRDRRALADVIDTVVSHHGSIDVVVAAAGAVGAGCGAATGDEAAGATTGGMPWGGVASVGRTGAASPSERPIGVG